MAPSLILSETVSYLHSEKLEFKEPPKTVLEGPTLPLLRELNVGQLLDETCNQYRDKEAVVSRWQGTNLSFQSLRRSSQDIARRLLLHGVRSKDFVVVLAGNSVEYTQLFFAVGGIGAVFAIINPTFTPEEAVDAVEFLDPVAIFIADRIGYRNNNQLFSKLAEKRGQRSLIVQIGKSDKVKALEGLEQALTWQQFLEDDPNDNKPDLISKYWAQADVHDTLCIQFTSGTTGPRKAAMLTHRNLLNNAQLVGERLEFTQDDIVCCSPPVYHCFGLVCGVLAAMMHGSKVVFPSDVFMAETTIRAISEERCTVIHAVPTMFEALLDSPSARKYSSNFRLRTGIIAGSSLSRDLLLRLAEEFGLSGLAYAFGQTELSAVNFMTSPSKTSLLDNHKSVGTLLPHVFARVVDSELNNVPLGDRGELLVSGFLVFQGYHKNPEKTQEVLVTDSHGKQWLRTGDIVTLSASGECTVIGRLKDMIKRGGESIFPEDIENVLKLHPKISTAAVIGIPDAQWGEVIGAFVKQTEETENEAGMIDLKIWLRNRIAPHKVPKHFFWLGQRAGVPDALPVNSTGKVVKKELREIAAGLV